MRHKVILIQAQEHTGKKDLKENSPQAIDAD